MRLEEVKKKLLEMGFRRVSLNSPYIETYVSDDYKVQVIVEENRDELTNKEEELIKERLRQLGYLE